MSPAERRGRWVGWAGLCLALWVGCAGHREGAPAPTAESGPFDHHQIEVRADVWHSRVRVHDRIDLRPTSGPLRFILHPRAELVSVTVDGIPAEAHLASPVPSWPSFGTPWEITPTGRVRTLEIALELPLERDDPSGGSVSNHGVYLPAGALWHPQRPGEHARLTWQAEIDREWTAIGPGPTSPGGDGEDGRIWRGAAALPLDALDLVLAPMVPFAGPPEGGHRAIVHLLRGDNRRADAWRAAAERQLDHLTGILGPLPCADFSVIEVPDAALEGHGWTFPCAAPVSSRELGQPQRADARLDQALSETWWGRAPAPLDEGDWRGAAAAWILAGAPTASPSGGEGVEWREAWLRDWRQGVGPEDERPLIEPGPQTPVRIGRGAMVLHQLERWIGREAFQEGLRRLGRGGAYGKTSWSALRAEMEAAARTDLGWFFDPWLGRLGAPRLTIVEAAPLDLDVPGRPDPVPAVRFVLEREGFSAPLRVPVVVEADHVRVHLDLAMQSPRVSRIVPLEALSDREWSGASEDLGRRPPLTYERRSAGEGANTPLDGADAGGPGAARSVRVDPDLDVLRDLYPQELLPRIRDVLRDPSVPVLAGAGENMVEDATLISTLLGRRTLSPAAVNPEQPRSLIVVTRWSAVHSGRAWVGPLALPLPRDLVLQDGRVWIGARPYPTQEVVGALAVPSPAGPQETVLLLLTESEDALTTVLPLLREAGQAGFLLIRGQDVLRRGRYEPGANPLFFVFEPPVGL